MDLGDAVLTLTTDSSQLDAGLKESKSKSDEFTGAIKNLVGAYMGFEGVKKATEFLKDCLNEFIEGENAAVHLAAALKATDQEYRNSSASLIKFAESMQNTTTYEDDATVQAAAMLIQLSNLTEQGVKVAMPAIMDLASAMGMDLNSAATLVAKALDGNVGALSRYGIQVPKAKDPSEQFDLVIQALEKHFGGMAEAMEKTTGGKLQQFTNQVKDAKEQAGGLLATFVTGYKDWANNFVGGLNLVWQGLKDVWGVWTDLTNLRNPFGKDSTNALQAYGERQDVVVKAFANHLTSIYEYTNLMVKGTTPAIEVMTDAEKAWADELERQQKWLYAYVQTQDDWIDRQAKIIQQTKDTAQAINNQNSFISDLARSYKEKLNPSVKMYGDKVHDATVNHQELTAATETWGEMAVQWLKDAYDASVKFSDQTKTLATSFQTAADAVTSIGKDLLSGDWQSALISIIQYAVKMAEAYLLAAAAQQYLVGDIPGGLALTALAAAVIAGDIFAEAAINATRTEGGGMVSEGPVHDDQWKWDTAAFGGPKKNPEEPAPAASAAAAPIENHIYLDGREIAGFVTRASRNGQILIRQRGIVP